MLDDFDKSGAAGRGRFGVSLAASVVVFGSISTAVVVASAMVRHVIVEEELVQVEFAAPPPPPVEAPPPPPPPPVAPPPVAQAAAPARLGRPRPQLQQPDDIPDARPEESAAPLVPPSDPFGPESEGDPNGTTDGVIGGAAGGAGTQVVDAPAPAPAPRPRGPQRVLEGTTPPQFDREDIARHFEIPDAVRSAGIARITVVVRVTVGEDGSIQRVDVLRGHPLIPNDNIVRAVQRSRPTPARMTDGTAYAAVHTLPITLAIAL